MVGNRSYFSSAPPPPEVELLLDCHLYFIFEWKVSVGGGTWGRSSFCSSCFGQLHKLKEKKQIEKCELLIKIIVGCLVGKLNI